MDRFRTVADQTGDLMDVARFAGFDDQAAQGALSRAEQVLVNTTDRQQRRNRRLFTVLRAIRDDQQRGTVRRPPHSQPAANAPALRAIRLRRLQDSIPPESSCLETRDASAAL